MSASINPLAQELNGVLAADSSPLLDFLSDRGRRAFFPSRGILGQSAAAKGKSINATIGTALEEDGSPLCLECVEDMTVLPPQSFLYAPSYGLPDLRKQWRETMIGKNPSLAGQPFSLPVVTHALTHGLYVAGQLFVAPGDRIILPDLYWDNYELLFNEACGAEFDTFPMFAGGRFNVGALAEKLSAPGEKKIVLLNFPNNPTGYTATEADAEGIVAALQSAAEAGKRVLALLDDAYFGLVYEDGVCRESLFTRLANLHRNLLAVKLDGATKEDYVWGLRVGFITFGSLGATPEQFKALESKAAGIVRGTVSSCSNLGQRILLEAYRNPGYAAQKQQKFDILCRRYRHIRGILAAHSEYAESFEVMPCNSGYFLCVRPNGTAPEAVRLTLLDKYQTGVIVLSGLIRIAFSSVPTDRLAQLFANIDSAIRDLKA
ncbi:MAG: aminotransferase class I/II-fold pyridoxal phosphate-dependent enzyme [Kiritimatiellae bacterium]|nr:aminotransferase class I/II-fold pyridoxal phosphate-dependent enzyme [Kiritimatiellia bacterium]